MEIQNKINKEKHKNKTFLLFLTHSYLVYNIFKIYKWIREFLTLPADVTGFAWFVLPQPIKSYKIIYNTWFIFSYLESLWGINFKNIKYIRFIMLMRILLSIMLRGKYLLMNKPKDLSFYLVHLPGTGSRSTQRSVELCPSSSTHTPFNKGWNKISVHLISFGFPSFCPLFSPTLSSYYWSLWWLCEVSTWLH